MNYEVIKVALEYYDYNCDKYKHLLEKNSYIQLISINEEFKSDIIRFHGSKNEFSSGYEILAMYTLKDKLWQWGWSLMIEKKLTRRITKILMYGVELEPKDMLIKKLLVDSSREIVNTIHIDIFVSIASYLSKSPFIVPIIMPENIVLSEIDSIDSLSPESYIIFIIILDPPL
jgi:hypothetical protein